MSFFAELKRRNVFKVGVAYAIVAWLLIEVVATVFPILTLPDWSVRLITVAIIIGFPIAIFFAWAFELTPEGIKPTDAVDQTQSITQATGRKLDFIIIGVLALAVVFLVVDNYVLKEGEEIGVRSEGTTVRSESDSSGSVSPPEDTIEEDILPNSVAVLPFENMSPNDNDAYFAAGLHEELLNQLAKLKNLNVIARTTMRQYANTEKSIQEIAGELNVETIMEGSVRYADGRIRVTTQLNNSVTGAHLWSETYEYEFKDIFAIESDIAMNVANAMRVEFSLAEQAQIEEEPTDSPEAYALYLSSINLLRQNTQNTLDGILLGLQRIDRAVELDPDSVLLLSFKASFYTYATSFFPELRSEYLKIAEQSARKALEIDANVSSPHVSMGMIATNTGDWQKAEQEFSRAVDLGISIPSLEPLSVYQLIVGRTREAYEYFLRLRKNDPLNFNVAMWELALLDIMGNSGAVMDKFNEGKLVFDPWPGGQMAVFYSLLGSGDIDGALEHTPSNFPQELKQILTDNLDNPDKLLSELREFDTGNTGITAFYIAALAAYFNDQGLALQLLERNLTPLTTHYLWRPAFRKTRMQDGFKQIMREIGLADFWKAHGWPEFCSPRGEDDFECE